MGVKILGARPRAYGAGCRVQSKALKMLCGMPSERQALQGLSVSGSFLCVSWVEGLGLGFKVSGQGLGRLPPAPTADVP